MRVQCRCGNDVSGVNIDLVRSVAKCDRCGEVFNCASQIASIATSGAPERPVFSLPQGMTVRQDTMDLILTRRWFSPVVIGMAFFCVFWDGFMIFWYTIAITKHQWAMAAFGSLHALVGVALTYGVMAGFLNATEIRVGQGMLKISHGPLPVPGDKKISSAEIEQLYTKQCLSHSEHGTSISYQVCAKTNQGKEMALISNVSQQDHALYIEQQIERRLHIRDEAVPGEIPR